MLSLFIKDAFHAARKF